MSNGDDYSPRAAVGLARPEFCLAPFLLYAPGHGYTRRDGHLRTIAPVVVRVEVRVRVSQINGDCPHLNKWGQSPFI